MADDKKIPEDVTAEEFMEAPTNPSVVEEIDINEMDVLADTSPQDDDSLHSEELEEMSLSEITQDDVDAADRDESGMEYDEGSYFYQKENEKKSKEAKAEKEKLKEERLKKEEYEADTANEDIKSNHKKSRSLFVPITAIVATMGILGVVAFNPGILTSLNQTASQKPAQVPQKTVNNQLKAQKKEAYPTQKDVNHLNNPLKKLQDSSGKNKPLDQTSKDNTNIDLVKKLANKEVGDTAILKEYVATKFSSVDDAQRINNERLKGLQSDVVNLKKELPWVLNSINNISGSISNYNSEQEATAKSIEIILNKLNELDTKLKKFEFEVGAKAPNQVYLNVSEYYIASVVSNQAWVKRKDNKGDYLSLHPGDKNTPFGEITSLERDDNGRWFLKTQAGIIGEL